MQKTKQNGTAHKNLFVRIFSPHMQNFIASFSSGWFNSAISLTLTDLWTVSKPYNRLKTEVLSLTTGVVSDVFHTTVYFGAFDGSEL